MSVLDQLRDLERQVVGRLRELEPLVHEYKQLRTAAGRLGVKYDPRPGASDSDQNVSSRRRRGARATPRSNASKRVPASASADRTGRSPKRAVPSAKSTGATRRAVRRRAAAPGQRQGQMLELVTAHPGITVAGIAQRLGIDATGLYRVMRRLTETGQIRKDGPCLYPSKQGQTPESAQATTPHTSGSGSHADSEAAAGGAKSSSTRRVAASARPR